jgi:molybdopterin-binding protein
MSNGNAKKIPALGFVEGVNVINGTVKRFKRDGRRVEVIIQPKGTRGEEGEEEVLAALIGERLFKDLKLQDGAEVYAEIHPLEVVIKAPPA